MPFFDVLAINFIQNYNYYACTGISKKLMTFSEVYINLYRL